jgi:hypothetical protein
LKRFITKSGKCSLKVFVVKKSQISQVFTYIAAILVIGAIAIVGTKAIISLLNADCETKASDFSNKLAKFIEDGSDKGSSIVETITLPCETRQVCLFDARLLLTAYPYPQDQVMESSVSDGSGNIFVVREFTEPALKATKLYLEDSSKPLCINTTNSYVKLRFTGLGKATLVTVG